MVLELWSFLSNFLGFIFQHGLDSGFKLHIGGIQDSDLGLQGPIHAITIVTVVLILGHETESSVHLLIGYSRL